MTNKQKAEKELRELEAEERELLERSRHVLDDGWNKPAAQLPSFGEIAMGVSFDPKHGTRNLR